MRNNSLTHEYTKLTLLNQQGLYIFENEYNSCPIKARHKIHLGIYHINIYKTHAYHILLVQKLNENEQQRTIKYFFFYITDQITYK